MRSAVVGFVWEKEREEGRRWFYICGWLARPGFALTMCMVGKLQLHLISLHSAIAYV